MLTLGLAWPRIKRWGAVEGAEVAAASLEQQQLQEKASAMVHEVLSDPKTGQRVEGLLKDSIKSLFADEEFTAQAVEWSARVLAEALTWENVQQKGVDYVIAVLDNDVSKETVRQYLAEAISNVVQDEKTQDDVATGIWSGVRASVLGRRWTKQQQASVPEVAVTEAVDAASASEDRGIRGASMKIGTESEKT